LNFSILGEYGVDVLKQRATTCLSVELLNLFLFFSFQLILASIRAKYFLRIVEIMALVLCDEECQKVYLDGLDGSS